MSQKVRHRPVVNRRVGFRGNVPGGVPEPPPELGLFLPENIAVAGTWTNAGTGGSNMDWSIVIGTALDLSRTTDSTTGFSVVTNADEASLQSTALVNIPDPQTFVMFMDVGAPDVSETSGVFDRRNAGNPRHTFFNTANGVDWSLGGSVFATQAYFNGRLVAAGRFKTDNTVDFYILTEGGSGSDLRDVAAAHVSSWGFGRLFDLSNGIRMLKGSIGEFRIWDSLLSDAQYNLVIARMREKWQV